jgi:hypothetical protein
VPSPVMSRCSKEQASPQSKIPAEMTSLPALRRASSLSDALSQPKGRQLFDA